MDDTWFWIAILVLIGVLVIGFVLSIGGDEL